MKVRDGWPYSRMEAVEQQRKERSMQEKLWLWFPLNKNYGQKKNNGKRHQENVADPKKDREDIVCEFWGKRDMLQKTGFSTRTLRSENVRKRRSNVLWKVWKKLKRTTKKIEIFTSVLSDS